MSARRFLTSLVGLALLGALAYISWPARLGGDAMFVVVRGHSMEPTYEMGDLLYARTGGEFHVGDVAIYRIPEGQQGAGTLVVHRIKKILGNGHFVFQGDNKPTVDDVTPDRADLVAKPVMDLGDLPTRALIVAPIIFTLLAAGLVTYVFWPGREDEGEAESPARRLMVLLDAREVDVDMDVDVSEMAQISLTHDADAPVEQSV